MPPIPQGWDRADGVTIHPPVYDTDGALLQPGGVIGTPTPSDAIVVDYACPGTCTIDGIPMEEEPDSPVIERAEQATITHRFRVSWATGTMLIQGVGRGSILTDTYGFRYFVLSTRLQRQKGGWATLEVTSEAKDFDSPPDEFSITPVELGINIIKHPRYFYAFLGEGYGTATELQNQMVIRLLQDYFENTTMQFRNALTKMLKDSIGFDGGYPPTAKQPPSWEDGAWIDYSTGLGVSDYKVAGTPGAKLAALEIIMKWWRGEETPYLVGYQITWSQYFFRPVPLHPGGRIENPADWIPDYFLSTVFPPDPGFTIFDWLAWYNPQSYSVDGAPNGDVSISWLRKADQIDYQRTWFRVERTWIGSPVGFWDADLYTAANRPDPYTGEGYRTYNT